ncbi:hypothetical protein PCANC_26810 [Puccinia coronata f. sp. avenae]|uniref:Uncharacterized protein n=1 Tax=Puccinia coronata f. sp. avenae TaxID=200324 RepID=A0A2N5U8N6_9BASI|nr:hypothetical protein PCANC_26810 [Puccinia coronata f. sp. avenae]
MVPDNSHKNLEKRSFNFSSITATSVAESLHPAHNAFCSHEERPHLHHTCHGIVAATPRILAVPLVWSVVLRTGG